MEGNGNKDTRKSPIKIRLKAMKNGYQSIYLDCYHEGRRSYEYLKLYLVPETDDKTACQNAAAMRQAEATLKARLRELKKQPSVSKRLMPEKATQNDLTMSEWFARFKEIQRSRGVKDLYAIDRLRDIITDMGHGGMALKAVGKDFCLSFMEYLKTGYRTASGQPLKSKTVFNRQCTLITALNVAVREGVIPSNPMDRLSRHERAKTNRGKREYLTIDEVKALIATPCKREDIKRAYLFACNCGLRLGCRACLGDKVELEELVLSLAVPVNVEIDGLAAVAECLVTDAHGFLDLGLFGYLYRSCHNRVRIL